MLITFYYRFNSCCAKNFQNFLMLLFPKKPKYLKSFTGRKIGGFNIKKDHVFRFSRIGLIANETGFVPNYQIEATRLFLRRLLKKRAQLFFRVFPDS